ncbi:unnamed protein product [Cuscuta campestris]|uniref:Uncharacterized protein n=1 Tax=Cuscuta campestris TaxID=132261 RepID=A0A484KZ83_9ASTE|nr:unnamed protein product [Cuscuta campestris]
MLMSQSDEELFEAFYADLNEVGRIGQECATRLLKSKSEEKAQMKAMMVSCQKDAEAAWPKAANTEEKLQDQSEAFRVLYAKHGGLLKAAKEADQAQQRIAELEENTARSDEEIAQLKAKLEKERSDRVIQVAAWAAQELEKFAAQALPNWEIVI